VLRRHATIVDMGVVIHLHYIFHEGDARAHAVLLADLCHGGAHFDETLRHLDG
jgi:hypothetical protein